MHNVMTAPVDMLRAKGPEKARTYARAVRGLYPLGIYLICVPVVDVMMRAFPSHVENVAWRFGIAGLVFSNVGTMLIGLSLIAVVATAAGDRWTLRTVASVGILGAVLILGLIGLYSLDTLQLRAAVNGPRAGLVLRAALTAVGAAVLGMLGFAGVGLGSLSVLRSSAKKKNVQASLEATVSLYPTITGGLAK